LYYLSKKAPYLRANRLTIIGLIPLQIRFYTSLEGLCTIRESKAKSKQYIREIPRWRGRFHEKQPFFEPTVKTNFCQIPLRIPFSESL
jgi:hypothetical protein